MKSQTLLAIAFIILWIVLIVCFYVLVQSLDITIEESFFLVYNFVKSQGIYGVLLFIVLYMFRPLLFIIASPFAILCGFVYGFPLAYIVFFVAEMCSVTFSYFFGKVTGGKLLTVSESFESIQKIEEGLRKNTFLYMLRLRLVGFPFDLLNYISGILGIPFSPYFFGTILGVLLYNIAFISAGVAFHGENITRFSDVQSEISPFYLIFAVFVLILTFVLSRLIKR